MPCTEIRRRYKKDRTGLFDHEYINPSRGDVSPQEAFYAEKEELLPIWETHGRICSGIRDVLSARHPHSGAGRARLHRKSCDYIVYAKEKGCSMTGPEDAAIERLNVLKGRVKKWNYGLPSHHTPNVKFSIRGG